MKKKINALLSIFVIIALLLVSCGTETDEYKLISESFAKYSERNGFVEINTLEKYTDDEDNNLEYYYFTCEITDEKYQYSSGGLIVASENGSWDCVSIQCLEYVQPQYYRKYLELKAKGKGGPLTEEQIEIVTKRMNEINAAKAESSAVTSSAEQ